MTLDELIEYTRKTATYPSYDSGSLEELSYLGLGLAGEAGEAVDCIKKMLRDPEDLELHYDLHEKLLYELGDLLWYWAKLVDALGYLPENVIELLVDKLEKRRYNIRHDR